MTSEAEFIKKILVIDDERGLREGCRCALARSESGTGSRFAFHLPVSSEPLPQVVQQSRPGV
jgi:hypothetical protein